MNTFGKLIGVLFGFGAIGISSILFFIFLFIAAVILVTIPLYFVWNYMSSVDGFVFLPYLRFLDMLCLVLLIRLLNMAWHGIKISNKTQDKTQDLQKRREIETQKKSKFSI